MVTSLKIAVLSMAIHLISDTWDQKVTGGIHTRFIDMGKRSLWPGIYRYLSSGKTMMRFLPYILTWDSDSGFSKTKHMQSYLEYTKQNCTGIMMGREDFDHVACLYFNFTLTWSTTKHKQKTNLLLLFGKHRDFLLKLGDLSSTFSMTMIRWSGMMVPLNAHTHT